MKLCAIFERIWLHRAGRKQLHDRFLSDSVI